jgi:hypothetical protein
VLNKPCRAGYRGRLLYVGMSRATHRLCLSAMGTSPIVDLVEKSLEKVQRAYQ